jgi:pimeloyl-ACP methyl ester carboxylesterase
MEADGSAVMRAASHAVTGGKGPRRPGYAAGMATFCLLHGAWHDGSSWADVAAELSARGHRALAPDLPLHDPAATYAARVQPALDALQGAVEPVVIVGHSMGSGYVPGVRAAWPQALEVHLCPGLGPLRDGFPFPQLGADGTCAWAPGAATAALYRRLPADVAAALEARLRPMAPAPDRRPPSPPRTRPPVVILAAEDELFAPASEAQAAQARLGVSPQLIAGGHMPMAEDPIALAGTLDRLAGGSLP